MAYPQPFFFGHGIDVNQHLGFSHAYTDSHCGHQYMVSSVSWIIFSFDS